MKNLATVAKANGRVRRSDSDLHRAAHKAIWEANHIVFESLTGLIAQIIESKTWRTFGHDNFASYALDATTNGLGVNTNQRLWILRCSMDVYGEHIAEWAEVLRQVEEMVRIQVAKSGAKLMGPRARSLEMLAKGVSGDNISEKITYLPSRQTSHDGHLMRLRKADVGAFRQVVAGKANLADVLRERRSKGVRQNDVLAYLRYHWNRATTAEKKLFQAWLREQGQL